VKPATTKAALTSLLGAMLTLAASILVHAQPPAPAQGPMVREGATTKLSDHVFIIPDNSVPGVPNVGIIVGRNATLVVDTGLGRHNGQVVVNEVAKVAANPATLYLVTTHVHPEHDLGAQAFPASTKMIRSRAQVNEIAELGQQTADAFRKRSEIKKELLQGAEFRAADVTFEDEHRLDLGGVHVRLLAVGPNHTPGDTAIFVEEDRVLFSGDVAMKALPAFASPKSSLDQWLKSLDRLEALKVRIIVPSHGPTGDAAFLANYRQYLTSVRGRTAALKAEGKTLEEATQIVAGELKTQYGDSGRMTGAIRAAYAEAK